MGVKNNNIKEKHLATFVSPDSKVTMPVKFNPRQCTRIKNWQTKAKTKRIHIHVRGTMKYFAVRSAFKLGETLETELFLIIQD